MSNIYVPGSNQRSWIEKQTRSADHFTGAIPVNTMEAEDIDDFLIGPKADVVMATIMSEQQLNYDLFVFSDSGHQDVVDINSDSFIGYIPFLLVASGRRIGAAGWYYLDVRLETPMRVNDGDGGDSIHLGLIPRSGAKLASNAGGRVLVKLWQVPVSGGN